MPDASDGPGGDFRSSLARPLTQHGLMAHGRNLLHFHLLLNVNSHNENISQALSFRQVVQSSGYRAKTF